jgi:serine/alanine adding enzyme
MARQVEAGHSMDDPADIRVVDRLDRETWTGFVDELDGSSVFHTPEMFDVFSRAEGYRPSIWAAVDDGGGPLALLLPVEISLMRGPLRYLTTRAVVFASVLAASGQRGRDAVSSVLRTYDRRVSRRVLLTELRNLVDIGELRPVLADCGYEFHDHLNFLIDLTRPLDHVWADIRPNARRNIRKAMKSGVEVRQAEDPADMRGAYHILREAYHRIRVPLPPSSLFHEAFGLLGPRGMMKVLVAEVKGELIGALMLLLHKDVVIYWYTGTSRDYSGYRPADLLVWRSLEMAHQIGARTFDFGGGGRPDEPYGVRDFKAKFGGERVNFGRHLRIHARARFTVAQAGYRMRRRLP